MRHHFYLTLLTLLLMLLTPVISAGISAETRICAAADVRVRYTDPHHADLTCTAVARAVDVFAGCNVPALSRPVRIDLVSTLQDNCIGLYHCGKDHIEILTPPALAAQRSTTGPFAALDTATFFKSVVVHELTHAATDGFPCPFDTCTASVEYVAYAMQVMSLPETARRTFEADADMQKRVVVDELNVFILLMAPDVFARKVWAHLAQRPDPCFYIGQILDGKILLDRERF